MEPIDFLKILRRRWKIIVLATLVAGAAAWFTTPAVVSAGRPVTSYSATTTMIQAPGATTPLAFVALLAQGGDVRQAAAEKLGDPGGAAALAGQVVVSTDDQLGTLSVNATGSEGPATAKLANTYAAAIQDVIGQQADTQRQAKIQELTKQITEANQKVKQVQAQLVSQPNSILLQAQLTAYTQSLTALESELVTQFSQTGSGSGLTIYQEATPIPVVSGGFSAPSSRHGRVLLGLAVGLALGVILALLIDRMDTRLRRRQDVEDAYQLSAVAEVPKMRRRDRRRGRVVALTAPAGAVAESYRGLRSALMLMPSQPLTSDDWPADGDGTDRLRLQPPQVVLITSARAGEGKSTTSANLAVTLAETGKRVLLLDADFRNPSLHALLDVAPGTGVADLLTAEPGADLAGLARPTGVAGVRLVTAGNSGVFHGALPSRVGQLLSDSRGIADVVIIDSAPLLVGNDALDFMPFVDSVVVVARLGRLTAELAERAASLLARMRVPVLGLVLVGGAPNNAASGKRFGGYGYGYGNGASSATSSSRRRAPSRAKASRKT